MHTLSSNRPPFPVEKREERKEKTPGPVSSSKALSRFSSLYAFINELALTCVLIPADTSTKSSS